jgi:inositol phosphorylceramide mannosyltransferase catalytic subunit
MMTLINCEQLWTDNSSRNFIEIQYPWFLSTYDGYRFPVQRVDALRYFLMLHYGGIYIDLDNVSISPPPFLSPPSFIST